MAARLRPASLARGAMQRTNCAILTMFIIYTVILGTVILRTIRVILELLLLPCCCACC